MRVAIRARSSRLDAPVFRSKLEMCELTVFSLITRARAISA